MKSLRDVKERSWLRSVGSSDEAVFLELERCERPDGKLGYFGELRIHDCMGSASIELTESSAPVPSVAVQDDLEALRRIQDFVERAIEWIELYRQVSSVG